MSFPLVYQAQHRNYKEDLHFWLDLASRHSGPVLEAGCGTGRVLIPLAYAGAKCFGMDHDLGMLRLLKLELPQNSSTWIHLIQADFTNFRLGLAFGLILMTCNTYTTLTSSERIRTIKLFKKHLRAGGVFAFSAPNPEIVRSLPRRSSAQLEDIFLHPIDGEPVQVSSEWERNQIRLKLTWHYDHLHTDGTVERLSVPICQNITSWPELESELLEAGFQIEKTWGDFDYSEYSDDSPQLIVQASC